ncbi:unnamed protein product, partial [Rotaria sp. Silwood2]
HIIEKYNLIFSHEKRLERLRNMLMKVNEKLLLVFNNIFVREYIDQIHQGIYKNSNKDNLPSYQKITEEKFLRIVDLMGKIRVTKEILDQLSDA